MIPAVIPGDSGARRILARLLPPTVWQRKTLVVWNAHNISGVQAKEWARARRAEGWECVCAKVHDSASVFGGPGGDNAQRAYYDNLRAGGLVAGGWGYLGGFKSGDNYACNPEAEADRAVERIKTLGLSFYISDPEIGYEFSPRDFPFANAGNARFERAIRFVQRFSHQIANPHFPRAVASYGRCDLHDQDWHAWLHGSPDGHVWRWAGQTYWNDSRALQPSLCIQAAMRAGWSHAMCHPMLGCFQGALGRVSGDDYAADLRRAGTLGFSAYDADSGTVELLPLARAGGVAR